MNIKKLKVKLASHYYLEAIDGIYDSSTALKAKLESELKQQADEIEADKALSEDDKGHMLSFLADDIFIAEITTNLAGEMMIVALYKTIEIAIKKMAASSDLFTPVQIASFYKMSELRKQFKNKVCDLKTIQMFKQFDELRCINNSIKHSGIVSKELAAYPGWKEGQSLTNLHTHYYRLRNDVDKFVEALQEEIIKKIPN